MNVNDTNIQDDRQLLLNQQQTKKCHGNRRDQRFRRKCRARGMKPAKIAKLLNKNKQINQKNNRINDYIRHLANENRKTTTVSNKVSDQSSDDLLKQQMATTTTNLNKRKRDILLHELKSNSTMPKSISSISIMQPLPKKIKKKPMTNPIVQEEDNNSINKNYRFVCFYIFFLHNMFFDYRRPMYLKRSPSILFQMLNKRLNYTLKKKDEQNFIYTRLNLLDQQYCLQVDLILWQSYLDIGIEQNKWPVSFSIRKLFFIVFFFYNNTKGTTLSNGKDS
jgi:hypothetical protein